MEGALTHRSSPNQSKTPSWFSPETGIYHSRHPPRSLPEHPFLDLPSFLFSHDHQGLTALVDAASGSSMSYPELRAMVRSMASGLHLIGVSAGQVVLILLPNNILFPVLFLGVLSVGAVATTMNVLSSPEEIGKRIAGCKVVMAFTSSDHVGKLDGLGIPVVAVPENLDSASGEFSHFNELLTSNPNHAPSPATRQADTAAILYSSGTSGLSKGAVITHGNLIAVAELFVRFEASQYPGLSSENVYLAAIPMFHVYGLSLLTVGLLALGSMVVVMRRFNVEEMVRAIERYEVTHFPVVPPIMAALIRAKGGGGGCDLRSLRQVSCGAAPLTRKLIQDFLKTFPHVDLIQGYGLTESTAVGARGLNIGKWNKYTSAGLLAPNMQAKVVDWKTGCCLPPGRSGELWLRGPGIMKGYLDDEDATSSAIDKDGWLRTGDLTYFDQDGYLFVLDRLKDTIKYKGFQIAPADLEALLINHPEILDVAVTSCEDEEAGEIPVAFVVRRPGCGLSSAEVVQYVAKQVAPYKKVRKVVFVDSIPKSAAGKTLRRLLRSSHGVSRM